MIDEIIAENRRRNAALVTHYDPLRGVGCHGDRVTVGDCMLPAAMVRDHPEVASLSDLDRDRLRVRYDFEFWCARCVTIKDKLSSRNVRFVPNAPQRRLIAVMEGQRQAGQPVRIILLKARQWGGSTLVQIYLAWLQIVHHRQWNSLICGHLKNTARAIKRMYNLLLRHYPTEMLDRDVNGEPIALRFRPFEGTRDVQEIASRECLVVMGSARSEDAVRGYDLAMAHLTEVAFWNDTAMHSPDDVIRSVAGTIAPTADTVVVYESTANGVGNFFHNEWMRAVQHESDKTAVFVPWSEIEIYRAPVDDAEALWRSLDDYEHALWKQGCTLEMIQWYHLKRKEYASHALMMAEFPSNDIEAFTATGWNVFSTEHLDALRAHCMAPVDTGDVEAPHKLSRQVRWVQATGGLMKVWRHPEADSRAADYMVTVDVGGRSDKADYSVIAVFDLHHREQPPEVVAQWRGHIDHDLLAWKAVHIARYYRNARLVIESNTLETEQTGADAGEYILEEIGRNYKMLYFRQPGKPGFQTNVKTKRRAIYELVKMVRLQGYVERDNDAVNEMATYEQAPNGKFAAMRGHHDDILMTRAIALYLLKRPLATPHPITPTDKQQLLFPL